MTRLTRNGPFPMRERLCAERASLPLCLSLLLRVRRLTSRPAPQGDNPEITGSNLSPPTEAASRQAAFVLPGVAARLRIELLLWRANGASYRAGISKFHLKDKVVHIYDRDEPPRVGEVVK